MRQDIYKSRVRLLHIAFWCIYLTFSFYQTHTFVSRGQNYSLGFVLLLVGLNFSILLSLAYLNYFYFLPKWVEKRNILKNVIAFLIPFVLMIFLKVHLQRFLMDEYTHHSRYFYTNLYIVQEISVTLFIVIFVGMLRFVAEWFELEAKKKEVENEKLTAELNFLKAQINPHFLFNTLNNLYYLAYTNSPNTPEVIAKLSQMMRYMLYDSNHSKVLLTKEIEYIQNYISLEKLRLNNEIPIEFTVKGNPDEAYIAPLILFTFLENAFKHGVINNDPGSFVKVLLDVSRTDCTYIVENSKISGYSKTRDEKSGIGLKNVKRRLELSYDGKHSVEVEDSLDKYSVILKLQLI